MVVLLVAGSLASCSGGSTSPIDAIASRYVDLARVSDDGEDVTESASALVEELERAAPSSRKRFLSAQLRALATPTPLASFDEESLAIYGVVAAEVRTSDSDRVRMTLDALLPGEGPLVERYRAFVARFLVPRERLETLLRAALEEARKRTEEHQPLPSDEAIELVYVRGDTWPSFHRYVGNGKSRIEMNLDFPMPISSVLDIACHEAYPGHHFVSLLLDWPGRPELTAQPVRGPQAIELEGLASYAAELAFPGDERLAFERDVLFPLAGLDPGEAALLRKVEDLLRELAPFAVQGARDYLDGRRDRVQTAIWLEKYALVVDPWAYLRFVDRYRSYVVAYTVGEARVRARVASSSAPWNAFTDLADAT